MAATDPGPPPTRDPDDAPGDPESAARIICLRLLERRARTHAELAQALARRGIPDAAAGRVLDRFGAVGLIDDVALAQTVASAQHHERGLAGRAIAQRLRRRGVPDDAVRAAVASIDREQERVAAQALVARKLPRLSALPTAVQARRLVGLLARRGYSAGLAYEVVRAALGEAGLGDQTDSVAAGFDAD